MRKNHRGSTNVRIRHLEAGYMSATQMFSMRDLNLQWSVIPYMSLLYRGRTTCKEVSDADTKRLGAARFEKVSSKYTKILDDGKTELSARTPRKGKRSRIPKSEAEKLHEAFVNYKDEILRFTERSEVPFSNNRAYIGIVEPNATSARPRCGKKSQAPIETPILPTPTAESQATCSRCHCKATA